jgi:succinyl-CoA synthetase beta subunit
MSFPEKTIAQVITVLRAQVRAGAREPSIGVQLAEGTTEEAASWRRWAIDYLTAKAKGVKYVDPNAVEREDFYGEIAGKRGEDDPRPAH